MVNKESKTYEATVALMNRSRNNEHALEQLLSMKRKATTTELAKALGWTINKTNSTLYRMQEKELIELKHIERNHRIVKEACIIPAKDYFK